MHLVSNEYEQLISEALEAARICVNKCVNLISSIHFYKVINIYILNSVLL